MFSQFMRPVMEDLLSFVSCLGVRACLSSVAVHYSVIVHSPRNQRETYHFQFVLLESIRYLFGGGDPNDEP